MEHPSDLSQFRPISVLSALSKPLELWLLDRIRHFIEPSRLQFGFHSRSSCEDAIASVEHIMAKGLLQCKGAARLLFVSLDVSRAFDQVNHNLLLQSLSDRGIPDSLVALFQSYLSNRQQAVAVGHKLSPVSPVISGVPQGSILGPFFFNCYVNPILELCPLSAGATTVMYCDDTVYIKPLSGPRAIEEANADLQNLLEAFSALLLELNHAKSKLMVVSADNKPSPDVLLHLGTNLIQQVRVLKYLGVLFDEKLKFHLHASLLAARVKKETGALHRSFGKWVPSEVFLRIFRQKLLPQLTYGLSVAAPRHKYVWSALEKTQRFALRLILNDFTSAYTVLLDRTGLVSVSFIYMKSCASLVYKYFYGLRYFPFHSELIVPVTTATRSLRTRFSYNSSAIQAPVQYNCIGIVRDMPIYRILSLWNLFSDSCISYAYSRFKNLVSDDENLFPRFCTSFDTRLNGGLSVFRNF